MGLTAPSTAAREAKRRDGKIITYLMTASTTIYKGDIVLTSATTGKVIPAGGGAHGDSFVGVAIETVTSAATGNYYIRVATEGTFVFDYSGAGQTDVGLLAISALAVNPHSVDTATAKTGTASTHDVFVGKITAYEATDKLRVLICPHGSLPVIA